jgi:methionyl-tRNA synthetase
MRLLVSWRETTVRDGDRMYVTIDGRRYRKSLTGTCLQCHTKKADSCDRCHDHLNVHPVCWDCHVEPAAGGKGAAD